MIVVYRTAPRRACVALRKLLARARRIWSWRLRMMALFAAAPLGWPAGRASVVLAARASRQGGDSAYPPDRH